MIINTKRVNSLRKFATGAKKLILLSARELMRK